MSHSYFRNQWANFMALLTVSKEPMLAEAENSVLPSCVIQGLAGSFGVCLLLITRYPTYAYTPSAEIRHLPCNQRMVIVSTEFRW